MKALARAGLRNPVKIEVTVKYKEGESEDDKKKKKKKKSEKRGQTEEGESIEREIEAKNGAGLILGILLNILLYMCYAWFVPL